MFASLIGRFPRLSMALLFSLLVLATRLPLAPQQLFSFDDVNFAYAIRDFDPRISQPQPPGYPLFVLETRLLLLLGFKRPESNLLAMAMLGSIAALTLAALAGDRFFGRPVGVIAALLLLFEPSFWYTALTSAVRVQLAVVSLAVGLLCYRVWSGETRFAVWSGLALGLGAGVRPELGPLLAPLWIAAMAKGGVSYTRMLAASGVTGATVLAWLIPTVLESGGWVTYYRMCVTYAQSQAGTLTSGLFGATSAEWLGAVCWLLVWLLGGLLVWPVVAPLAWRREDGFGLTSRQGWFFALWFMPSFLFAALFHVADPGHVQAMTPVVCLLAGALLSRAATLAAGDASPGRIVLLAQLPLALPVASLLVLSMLAYVWVGPALAAAPFVSLAIGVLVRLAPGGGTTSRWLVAALLLFPILAGRVFLFSLRPVYYKPRDTGIAEQITSQAFIGLGMSSLPQVRGTVDLDDHAISVIRGLAGGRPEVVVVWKEGTTTWRKVAYYLNPLTVVALERKPDGSALARYIQGGHVLRRLESPSPVTVQLPAGARVVWLVDPRKPFFQSLKNGFPLVAEGPVYYHDLPETHGERVVENYRLEW
jgi:hypothetical protein